jgi:tetratricopeptide (TPR) repeat protein
MVILEMLALAKEHHRDGRLPDAARLYRQILQRDARHVETWCLLGLVCYGMNDFDEAIARFQQALQLKPEAAEISSYLRQSQVMKHYVLASVPGVRLYSLQWGAGHEQLTAAAGLPITDLGERLGDFGQTAAIVRNLDLVITCDSSAAHLAGALGIPVWVALASSPDWRWMLQRSDSPWYPTMRLFRQSLPGDWRHVVQQMEAELRRTT